MSASGNVTVRRFVRHARRRMAERQVTKGDVLNALSNYVQRQPTSRPDSVLYIGPGESGAELKVWVELGEDDLSKPQVVLSVAWRDDNV